jgi:hypothetical protein
MTPGKFAEQFSLLVQESFYNSWARVHGVKKKAICLPNGNGVTKGYSCRRNDMHLLGDTDMDSRLENVTEFMCLGDSAYPHMARITRRNNLDDFEDINRALNGCRISIEWMFRDITTFWKLVTCKDILKLLDGFINCDNL